MNIYNIDLEIDTNKKFITSIAKLIYNCKTKELKELNLYIHKDIEVEYINCDKEISYQISKNVSDWCPFILESKSIKIAFKKNLNLDEKINIEFKYKGYLDIINPYGVNRLTKEWIELGIYTPWFPLIDTLEVLKFNVKIDIDSGYEVINSKYEYDSIRLEQQIPFNDCTIIASKDFKNIKIHVENICISVYYTSEKHKDLADKISNISKIVMKQYIPFGNVGIGNYSIVIAPREDGGGYCRPNLIVVTPDDDYENEVEYFKFIAHELAHIWWNKANTNSWEDWLNESFAEYSAMIAIRQVYGESYFNELISKYRRESKNLPPIRNMNRSDSNAYSILYRKGTIILNSLENIIGKYKFQELLHKTHINEINTTDKFLNTIEININQELRTYLDEMLDLK